MQPQIGDGYGMLQGPCLHVIPIIPDERQVSRKIQHPV